MTRHRVVLILAPWAISLSACSSPTAPSSISPPAPAVSSPLSVKVASATMIEFREFDGAWGYAPQIQVAETSGRIGVTVTSANFAVPGLGSIPGCLASKRIEPGGTLEVFGVDGYGNYEISFGQGTVRATPGNAVILLDAVDDAGHAGTVTWQGPVTAGQLPPPDGPRTMMNACHF